MNIAPLGLSRLPAIVMCLFGILGLASVLALAWTGGTSSTAYVLMALGLFGFGISLVVRIEAAQDPASGHRRRARRTRIAGQNAESGPAK